MLINDIISNHKTRMLHLKKYLPLFRLWDNGLNLYREGQYAYLDMPYITMAVIRYFIEENSFNDRPVTYEMYSEFLKHLLKRDFDCEPEEEDADALVSYIFDKLCNEGKAFSATWFEPEDKAKKIVRVKLFESRFLEGKIVYEVTADAIEFYLDTKEIKDESPITVQQVLLGKMVISKDFQGAIEVIRRINQEVAKMVARKDQIIRLFAVNVFEGAKELEAFSKQGLKWFEEEQKMFASNKELIDQAMQIASAHQSAKEIYAMDAELKKAMKRHGDLLSISTELQVQADEMITRAKQSRFRQRADFNRLREVFLEADNTKGLEELIQPLFALNTRKTMEFSRLDHMLDYKPEERHEREKIEEAEEKVYIYEDEIEDRRIEVNYRYFLKVLFQCLLEKDSVDLQYLRRLYKLKFGEEIYQSGDFYGFFVHISQKATYDLSAVAEHQDTFLEGIMAKCMEEPEFEPYKKIKFKLIFDHETVMQPLELFEMTNIIFERIDD